MKKPAGGLMDLPLPKAEIPGGPRRRPAPETVEDAANRQIMAAVAAAEAALKDAPLAVTVKLDRALYWRLRRYCMATGEREGRRAPTHQDVLRAALLAYLPED